MVTKTATMICDSTCIFFLEFCIDVSGAPLTLTKILSIFMGYFSWRDLSTFLNKSWILQCFYDIFLRHLTFHLNFLHKLIQVGNG